MSFSLYGFNSGFYGNNPHIQRGNGYFNNFLSNEQKKKETTSSQFNNIGKIAMTKTNYHFIKSPQNQNNQSFKSNNNISPSIIQQESKNNITDAINRNFLNINYKPSPRNNENKNKTYNTGLYLSTNIPKVPTNNILDNKKDEEDMNKLTNQFDKLKITQKQFPSNNNSIFNPPLTYRSYINNSNQTKQFFNPYSSTNSSYSNLYNNNNIFNPSNSQNNTLNNLNNNNNYSSSLKSSFGSQMDIETESLNPTYIITKYSFYSKAGANRDGQIKENQDSCIAREIEINNTKEYLFGIFDGHGLDGHFVSQSIKQFFQNLNIENLKQKESIISTYKNLSNQIQTQKNFDVFGSGSTCVILYITPSKITSANTGDSRGILITTDNRIIKLSNDHKPEEPNEKMRIEQNGGRVSQAYGMGPFRVWLKTENYPGLAMSRSIGDKIAHSVGVSDIPEIMEFNLDDNKPKAVIVASDGIWEFLSNENVKDVVLRYYDCGDADLCARELCENARRIWESSGYAIDDITAVVGFFGEK